MVLYVKPPSKGRSLALHCLNLEVLEVMVGERRVEPCFVPHHKQETLDRDNLATASCADVADHATDDYRAALKSERLVPDLCIPMPEQQQQQGGAPMQMHAWRAGSYGPKLHACWA